MTLSFSANTVKELFSSLPFSSSMTNASMNNSASSLLTSFSFTLSQSQAYSTSLVIFTMTAAFATLYQKYTFASLVGGIYNAIIVNMTQVWYKRVLEKQNDGATILDVGIGTAGALLQCKDIIQAKNLKIIGVDYNNLYIQAAQEAIHKQNMSQHISVHTLDIYDQQALQTVLQTEMVTRVDSAYFSGSFSLMPDPMGALKAVSKVLVPGKGKIYITQTYQKRTPPLMTTVKPMLKFITTVDFGQLVTVEDIGRMLRNVNVNVNVNDNDNDMDGLNLNLEEHGVMEDSVNNYWQAAYLSVLTLTKGVKKVKNVDDSKKKFFWERWGL